MSTDVAALPPALGAHVARQEPAEAIADALRHPVGVLELHVGDDEQAVRVDGIFGAAGYVLATDVEGDELMTGASPALPLQIARLVALGPRPVPAEPVAARGPADGLAASVADRDMPAAIVRVVEAPGAVRWSARASWAAPEGVGSRVVAVIDGGAQGLLQIASGGGEEVVAATVRALDVWRALCGLLPYPAEVAGP